mgnify:CR=1 FL=1
MRTVETIFTFMLRIVRIRKHAQLYVTHVVPMNRYRHTNGVGGRQLLGVKTLEFASGVRR